MKTSISILSISIALMASQALAAQKPLIRMTDDEVISFRNKNQQDVDTSCLRDREKAQTLVRDEKIPVLAGVAGRKLSRQLKAGKLKEPDPRQDVSVHDAAVGMFLGGSLATEIDKIGKMSRLWDSDFGSFNTHITNAIHWNLTGPESPCGKARQHVHDAQVELLRRLMARTPASGAKIFNGASAKNVPMDSDSGAEPAGASRKTGVGR